MQRRAPNTHHRLVSDVHGTGQGPRRGGMPVTSARTERSGGARRHTLFAFAYALYAAKLSESSAHGLQSDRLERVCAGRACAKCATRSSCWTHWSRYCALHILHRLLSLADTTTACGGDSLRHYRCMPGARCTFMRATVRRESPQAPSGGLHATSIAKVHSWGSDPAGRVWG